MPGWLQILLDTGEFLAFGLYFLLLVSIARQVGTDAEHASASKLWAYIEFGLFILFTALFFLLGDKGLPHSIFGALYLVTMIVAITMTIRMKRTLESTSS